MSLGQPLEQDLAHKSGPVMSQWKHVKLTMFIYISSANPNYCNPKGYLVARGRELQV